ncbi:MAG: cation:proton antiporter [Verrucomicrobia bacterium]|nr:cation:proton antiporter [Verrucomicrobiota bacterium]
MHAVAFLQDLAVVLIVAGIVTVVFRRLRQPVVLGYIMAGMIVGPHTPPYALIRNEETINTLAELGVILLMFALGLEFSLRKLRTVGAPALLAALMEIVLLFWLGYEVGRYFGWATMDSIFLGAMLSMSSTTVIIKVLGELDRMKEGFAHLVFGILIIEDILGIAMIALLSGIAMTGTVSLGDVGLTLGKLSAFLAVALIGGLLAVPRLISYVARFRSNEMLVVTVLGLCFGFSLLAAKLGYSVALGAFIIGAVIAETREIHRIEGLVEPIRDMFSAVFFVAIGLLIDPRMLVEHWQPILVLTLAVVVGKIFTCTLGAFLGGKDLRTSLHVGMSLAQIGEFSFIIASLGVTLKVTSSFLYPVAVAVSAVTTLLTPYLIRAADRTAAAVERGLPPNAVRLLRIYTEWIGAKGEGGAHAFARTLMWKWGAQMALNTVLTAAIFIGGAYLAAHPPGWLGAGRPGEPWVKTLVWLVAAVVSLPFFIATARKLQALGLLLAETKVTEERAGERTRSIRAVIAAMVPIAGSVALGLFILVLSSALLPPLNVLGGLLVVVGLVAWMLSRSFHRVYTSAQAALIETFQQHAHAAAATEERSLLDEANLAVVVVPEQGVAAGRMIRELALRTTTGASIVALERAGRRQINPGPDEEILAGDRLLLLGTAEHLAAARKALGATGAGGP